MLKSRFSVLNTGAYEEPALKTKPSRPRKERSENAARRRKQIVDATLESISRYGLSGTTLATVAALADMSQGSTIFYFQTKDQLLTAAFNSHCEDYRERWLRVYNTDFGDPVEHLAAMILVDFDAEVCTRREISLWFDFWGETQSRPPFRELSDQYGQEYSTHLAILVAKAESQMSPDWTVESFTKGVDAMVDGLWLQFHTQEGDVDREGARRLVARFIASVFPASRDMVLGMAE